MAAFKTLDDIGNISGKRVLVRVDLNVPVIEGKVTDTTRIERIAPTIAELSGKGAKVILLAHFGRPKDGPSPEFSLEPIAKATADVLGRPVGFASDCVGDAHRAHSSTEGLAHLLPAFAGRTMQAELEALEKGLGKPVRPVVAIVGGAKVSTKIDLLMNLVKKVDALVIGGGMANTFLAARGTNVGKSLCEHDLAATAKQIMIEAAEAGCAIILPVDGVVAKEFKAGAECETVAISDVPADGMILD
ncbi:MAG: phosphoglycerate kinase, partial [Mesorhizobium sp.]